MSYAINVMVIDRKTRKGKSGYRVKASGGAEVKTDASGMATVITSQSSTSIYVDGTTVYSGYASKAPNPILCEKG